MCFCSQIFFWPKKQIVMKLMNFKRKFSSLNCPIIKTKLKLLILSESYCVFIILYFNYWIYFNGTMEGIFFCFVFFKWSWNDFCKRDKERKKTYGFVKLTRKTLLQKKINKKVWQVFYFRLLLWVVVVVHSCKLQGHIKHEWESYLGNVGLGRYPSTRHPTLS